MFIKQRRGLLYNILRFAFTNLVVELDREDSIEAHKMFIELSGRLAEGAARGATQ